MSSVHVSLGEVAASLALTALAVVVSAGQRTRLEDDIVAAAASAFVQLSAVGYVIKVVFEQDRLTFVVALLIAMTLVGALTARRRAAGVSGAFLPLFIALGLAAAATLGLVVALGVFAAEPRYLVPVGGMVIGNAMTAAAVALNRLGDDVRADAPRIEATLALGAPAQGGSAAGHATQPALGADPSDRFDQDDGAGLLPGNDGRDAARRRGPRRRGPPPARPALRASRRRSPGHIGCRHPRPARLHHPSPPAPRASAYEVAASP